MSRQTPPLTAALADEAQAETRPADPAPHDDLQPVPEASHPTTAPLPHDRDRLMASAAYPTVQSGEPWEARPLIDPAIILQTLWDWRKPIALLTATGVILGVALALSLPKKYTGIAEVLVDPRQIKLAERDLTPEFLANEAALAIIDSKLSLVTSTPVLEKVVKRTTLAEDIEFNGTQSSFFEGLNVFRSILSGDTKDKPIERVTLENLRDEVEAFRSPRTFNVTISATSKSPEKAAILANAVATAFIEEQGGLQISSARTATEALTGRLADLQKNVADAETKVEEFRAANNLLDAQGRPITEDELLTLQGAVTRARAQTIDAKAKADEARSATLNSALTGGLPSTLVSPVLATLRTEYSSLNQQLAQAKNRFGPRHPRLGEQQAAVDAARNDIAQELQRIVAGTQADLRSAIENERQLAAELARLKAQLSNTADEAVQLDELEREAAVAREIYQNALLRARETGEMEAVGQTNARLISPAEPPEDPSSLSRKLIVIGSALAGFALGAGLAIISGIAKSLKLSALARPTGPARPSGPRQPGPQGGGGFRQRPTGKHEHEAGTKPAQQEADQDMYPYNPYQPYPAFQQSPQPQPQGWPQQVQPQAYAPQPQYQPAPPMMPQQPFHGAPPMPQQGWMPQPPMPQYQPQPQMMPQTHYVYVPAPPAPTQPQPVQSAPEPTRRDDLQAEKERRDRERQAEDIDLLRQSVSDIRDVLGHLTARRFG